MKWEIVVAKANKPEDLGGEHINEETGERRNFLWFVRFSTTKNEAQFVIPYEIIRDIYKHHEKEIHEDENN